MECFETDFTARFHAAWQGMSEIADPVGVVERGSEPLADHLLALAPQRLCMLRIQSVAANAR